MIRSVENTISTVICAFNAEKFILQTLYSIEGQSHQPDEVIIINDGSTDDTLMQVQSFKNNSILNIKIISKKNEGLNLARIEGFNASSGNLIHWMDADDIVEPEFYAHIERTFATDPTIGMAYSKHKFIDSHGEEIQRNTPRIARAMLSRFWIYNIPEHNPELSTFAAYCWSDAIEPMCVFRRKAYAATSGWPTQSVRIIGEGALLMTELSLYYRMIRIEAVLFRYRIHPNQLTSRKNIHKESQKLLPQFYRDHPSFQTPRLKRLIKLSYLGWRYRLRASRRIDAFKHNLRFHPEKAVIEAFLILKDYSLSAPIMFASNDTIEKLNSSRTMKTPNTFIKQPNKQNK